MYLSTILAMASPQTLGQKIAVGLLWLLLFTWLVRVIRGGSLRMFSVYLGITVTVLVVMGVDKIGFKIQPENTFLWGVATEIVAGLCGAFLLRTDQRRSGEMAARALRLAQMMFVGGCVLGMAVEGGVQISTGGREVSPGVLLLIGIFAGMVGAVAVVVLAMRR